MVSQGAHASLAVLLDEQSKLDYPTKAMKLWLTERFTKICVSVNSEAELFEIHKQARLAGIPCSLIKDAGLTEFDGPTYTAVAIGPDFPDKIDPITGALPLL